MCDRYSRICNIRRLCYCNFFWQFLIQLKNEKVMVDAYLKAFVTKIEFGLR